MMDINTEDIWSAIDEVLGYDEIPAQAITVRDIMDQRGINENPARRVVDRLVSERGWHVGKRGYTKYYWPAE